MSQEIGLVSCVKSKRDAATVPRDLYTSDYFDKMSSYAEQNHDDWFVLSAKHGLLHPGGPQIDPYDETLRHATKSEKRRWAESVFQELQEQRLIEPGVTLVIHAGKDYYEELLPLLKETNVSISIPTEGMGIGKKKAWYKDRL